MFNKSNLLKLMLSPFRVMVISVIVSILFFLILSIILNFGISLIGILISAIIPAVISFPMSYILIRHHNKIHSQKNELNRLNEINSRLISIIAHDIRSPLSSVYGILDLIKIDSFSKEQLAFYINNLSGTVDHLLKFLEEVLQWSKSQIDDTVVQSTHFTTEEIWNQTLALYQYNIDSKNINIVTKNVNQPIFGNRGCYSFIIRNVLHNAIKFTPQQGTITINMVEKENRTLTIIEDNGIGMCQEKLDKILAGNDWISTPGTENEKGTGFGLKAATKYVELQNGDFNIVSVPGEGSKVTIDLPRNPSN